jgi:hypothetical protein
MHLLDAAALPILRPRLRCPFRLGGGRRLARVSVAEMRTDHSPWGNCQDRQEESSGPFGLGETHGTLTTPLSAEAALLSPPPFVLLASCAYEYLAGGKNWAHGPTTTRLVRLSSHPDWRTAGLGISGMMLQIHGEGVVDFFQKPSKSGGGAGEPSSVALG